MTDFKGLGPHVVPLRQVAKVPAPVCWHCKTELSAFQREFCNPVCRRVYREAHPEQYPRPRRYGIGTLSARERQVYDLFLSGKRWKEIAEQLGISAKTVDSYRAAIMRKLPARTLVDLVRIGISEGLLQLESPAPEPFDVPES